MNDITRVLRAASQRLFITRVMAAFIFLLTAAIGTALLLRIAEVFGVVVPWGKVALWSGVGVVAGSFFWALVRPAARIAVARRVDEGADLKESLSTALCVEKDRSPWSVAMVESAAQAARRVDVRRAVPIRAPRQWPVPLVAALGVFVCWFILGSIDPLGSKALAKVKQEDQKKVEQAKAEAKAAEAKVEELIAKVDPTIEKKEDPKAGEANQPKANNPEDIRRAAIKSLTDMKDRLEKLKGSAKSMAGEALKDKMQQLKPPGPGPLSDVARAMAQADFDKAADALKELSQKLTSGEMPEGQRQELAKQLDKMKDQLAKLAADQKDLEKKLEEAGLDKKLANADPEALKKALEQMQNLSEEQKQQLAEMAKSMQQANQLCQNMSQSMGQMGQGMKKDGMNQEGMEGMEGMQGQLGQGEMMMKDMESVEAALAEAKFQLQQMSQKTGDSECKGGMGQCEGGLSGNSPWKGGEDKKGTGSQNSGSRDYGGYAEANGGTGTTQKDDENWQKRKARAPMGDGPTIGTTLVQGDQIKGESKAKFQAAADAAAQQATEALESNAIPREYHDVIKHYFGRLQAKTKGEQAPQTPATPATDAKPAAPAADAPKK